MSYIRNGKFYKGAMPPQDTAEHGLHKGYLHDRQRENHQKDLLQPFLADGRPNERFIEEYPESAVNYGLIKGEDNGKDQGQDQGDE